MVLVSQMRKNTKITEKKVQTFAPPYPREMLKKKRPEKMEKRKIIEEKIRRERERERKK
jgi:hypothetical protein